MTKVTRPKRKVNDKTVTMTEEDGTQVEKTERKPGVRTVRKTTPDQAKYIEALKQFVNRILDEKGSVKRILGEHLAIKQETQSAVNKEKTAFEAHQNKNRYRDVVCIDPTRVILTFPEGSDDYIHANWVKGADEKPRYICTQGPKENTIEDFWRMVWQEKCRSVIMLCNIFECNKKKCEKYWPDAETPKLSYPSGMTVKFLKQTMLETLLIQTKIEVEVGDGKLTVEHVQWKDWPDRGAPEANLMAMRLIVRIRENLPSVIHCSAGIGRTGTVVGLDLLQTKLEKGECPTMASIMRELRDQRHGSIQTDVQYAYMHRVMLLVAVQKKILDPKTDERLKAWVTDYEASFKSKG